MTLGPNAHNISPQHLECRASIERLAIEGDVLAFSATLKFPTQGEEHRILRAFRRGTALYESVGLNRLSRKEGASLDIAWVKWLTGQLANSLNPLAVDHTGGAAFNAAAKKGRRRHRDRRFPGAVEELQILRSEFARGAMPLAATDRSATRDGVNFHVSNLRLGKPLSSTAQTGPDLSKLEWNKVCLAVKPSGRAVEINACRRSIGCAKSGASFLQSGNILWRRGRAGVRVSAQGKGLGCVTA